MFGWGVYEWVGQELRRVVIELGLKITGYPVRDNTWLLLDYLGNLGYIGYMMRGRDKPPDN
jgi:hypothetical protein